MSCASSQRLEYVSITPIPPVPHDARPNSASGAAWSRPVEVRPAVAEGEGVRGCAGWVGLKTLVAGLAKGKGEGDIPSHVDDTRCFSLVFSGNSAVGLLVPHAVASPHTITGPVTS